MTAPLSSPVHIAKSSPTPIPAEFLQRLSTEAHLGALENVAQSQGQPEQIAAIQAAQRHGQSGSPERFQTEARVGALEDKKLGMEQGVADEDGRGYTKIKDNRPESARKANSKNIDEYIAGTKSFDDATEDYAKLYAETVHSNQQWKWEKNIPNGINLTRAQKTKIKEIAIAKGYIPEIKIYKVDGKAYADFKGAGVVKENLVLPESMWHLADAMQFQWLNEQIESHALGYTWHHTETPGAMELVPYGIHNITFHNGGRTPGMWADAPR